MNWKKPFMFSKKAPRTDLKKEFKDRILKGVIKKINESDHNITGSILILDDISSEIIGRFLSIPELSQEGVLFIENIMKKRKKFKNLHGIYLIAPTTENFRKIEQDFEKKGMYAKLHICTTQPIPNDIFEKISTFSMVSKISTLKELNIDLFMHNMFTYR